MTLDEFFAEAKRLGCRMVPDNPADVRAVLDLKDAEIARLQAQVDALAGALRKIVDQDMSFLGGYVMANVIKREDILAGRAALAAAGR